MQPRKNSVVERKLDVVLIVDDDADARRAIVRAMRGLAGTVVQASGALEAIQAIADGDIDLVVLDVRLGADSGVEVARAAASMVPAPAVIAVGTEASPHEAFSLAQLGVRALVPQPLLLTRAHELVELARRAPPLEAFAKAQVGARSVREVQDAMREVMLREALALENGSVAGAARRLGISRQAVQQMMRRRGAA